jgi:hypothetical protein
MKYSEIHTRCTSSIVADVFARALLRLPPFFQVWTDNAMIFTMKYSAHPERRTTFARRIEAHGLLHTLIAKGSPWRNGFCKSLCRRLSVPCRSSLSNLTCQYTYIVGATLDVDEHYNELRGCIARSKPVHGSVYAQMIASGPLCGGLCV